MLICSFLVLKSLLYIIIITSTYKRKFYKSCVDLVLIVLKVSMKKNDSGVKPIKVGYVILLVLEKHKYVGFLFYLMTCTIMNR